MTNANYYGSGSGPGYDTRSGYRMPDDPGIRRPGGDFMTQLTDAVKENPVPAALIGMGVVWMFLGGRTTTSILGGGTRMVGQGARYAGEAAYDAAAGVGSAVAGGAQYATRTVGSAVSGAADMTRRAAGAVGGVISGAASTAADTASGAYDTMSSAGERGMSEGANLASGAQDTARDWGRSVMGTGEQLAQSVRETGGQWANSVSDTTRQWGGSLQQTLSEAFERQPLLVGAAGLAIGAAIAASLPTTRVEAEYFGETSDSLKDQAKEFVSTATDQAKSMAQKALDEAKSQGLSPEAAKDALQGTMQKVQGLAKGAQETVKSKARSAGTKPS